MTFKFPKFWEFARNYLLDTFSDSLVDVTSTPIANPTAAIILGRTWDLPGILKRAFYELLRAQPDAPNSHPSDDGNEVAAHRLQGLEVDDIIRLSDTQKHLTAAWLTVLSLVTDKCPTKTPCAAARPTGGWSAIVGEDLVLQKFQYDPICGLDVLIRVDWTGSPAFCTQCAAARKAWLIKKKKQIWDNLDQWLSIPVIDEDQEDEGTN